jgi:hypothetical protein
MIMAVDSELNAMHIGSERSSYFNDYSIRDGFMYLGDKHLSLY